MKPILSVVAFVIGCGPVLLGEDFPPGAAQNWHQWRGPTADGVSRSADPPVEWSPTKNIRWKIAVPGSGSSTPIIWEDRLFLTSAIETDRKKQGATTQEAEAADEEPSEPRGRGRFGRGGFRFGGPPPTNYYQFVLYCYDRNTGRLLWRKVAAEEVPHEPGHPTNTFASGSPITDGEHVYVSFGSRGVFCYDLAGNLEWKRDLGQMRTRAGFGEGSSPALYRGTLVVPWDHEGDSSVVALDAATGEEKWRASREERTTWATPLIVDQGGRTQVITNGGRVRSYDLDSGELLWECGGQASNPIPSPVADEELVYCMTGYRGYAIYAIPLDASGDVTDTDTVAWFTTDAAPYVLSPVLYSGHLYFTKSRNGVLLSRDAKTGELLIDETRIPGIDSLYASPVAAAGRIYVTGRNGTTVVFKHGPTFEVLASNRLDEGIDASPALVGSDLFLRGEKHLYCISAQ